MSLGIIGRRAQFPATVRANATKKKKISPRCRGRSECDRRTRQETLRSGELLGALEAAFRWRADHDPSGRAGARGRERPGTMRLLRRGRAEGARRDAARLGAVYAMSKGFGTIAALAALGAAYICGGGRTFVSTSVVFAARAVAFTIAGGAWDAGARWAGGLRRSPPKRRYG